MIIFFACAVLFICLVDGIQLFKKKTWKELTVFSVLIGISILLVTLKSLGFPTPIELLEGVIRPIGQSIFKPFGNQ